MTTSGSSAAVAEAHVYLSSRSCTNDVSQAVVYLLPHSCSNDVLNQWFVLPQDGAANRFRATTSGSSDVAGEAHAYMSSRSCTNDVSKPVTMFIAAVMC